MELLQAFPKFISTLGRPDGLISRADWSLLPYFQWSRGGVKTGGNLVIW